MQKEVKIDQGQFGISNFHLLTYVQFRFAISSSIATNKQLSHLVDNESRKKLKEKKMRVLKSNEVKWPLTEIKSNFIEPRARLHRIAVSDC